MKERIIVVAIITLLSSNIISQSTRECGCDYANMKRHGYLLFKIEECDTVDNFHWKNDAEPFLDSCLDAVNRELTEKQREICRKSDSLCALSERFLIDSKTKCILAHQAEYNDLKRRFANCKDMLCKSVFMFLLKRLSLSYANCVENAMKRSEEFKKESLETLADLEKVLMETKSSALSCIEQAKALMATKGIDCYTIEYNITKTKPGE